MEEVIDWHSIPRGSAFTFVGMPSDVDIVYYLGRSLVTPLIAILESESGAIYKKPLAVLRHWPEHDKRAQPAVDDALAAVAGRMAEALAKTTKYSLFENIGRGEKRITLTAQTIADCDEALASYKALMKGR